MAGQQSQLALQATDAFVIVGSDTNTIDADGTNNPNRYKFCALYTGAGGSIKVTLAGGGVVTFSNTIAGTTLPVLVKQVWANPTPPAGILGLIGSL